jgi:hypothetical protein
VRPIPSYFGIAIGGRSHPKYAVWVTEDGFSVVKNGKEEAPYILTWIPRSSTWTCTCWPYIKNGSCKHTGIVHDILTDAILEGRLR